MSKWHEPSDNCLICRGPQEVVVGVRERGPYERMHDYTRVLFCAACEVGELRTFSYDDFVVFGEEDDVMVWSSVLSAADVARLAGTIRPGATVSLRVLDAATGETIINYRVRR